MTRSQQVLGGILLLALGLRLPGAVESLWLDEVAYTNLYFQDPDKLSTLLSWKQEHPPFYSLLLLTWTRLGDSELMVRLPSLLAGLVSIVLIGHIARDWLGASAPVAALLLALSAPHSYYSTENKVNMLALLLGMALVYLYWRAAREGGARLWFAAGLALLQGLYTHLTVIFVALAVFLWLLWRARERPSLCKPILLTVLAIGVTWVPFFLYKMILRGDALTISDVRPFGPGDLYRMLLVWLPLGNALYPVHPLAPFTAVLAQPWPLFLVNALVALILLRGIGVAWRTREDWSPLLLLWLFVPLSLTVGLAVAVDPHYYVAAERNVLVAVPPYILLLVLGARASVPAQAALVAVFLAAAVHLPWARPHAWTAGRQKPDWRAATRWLAEQEGFLTIYAGPVEELEYYLPRVRPDFRFRLVDLTQVAQADLGVKGRAWVIQPQHWQIADWDELGDRFAHQPGRRIVATRKFAGLVIYEIVEQR